MKVPITGMEQPAPPHVLLVIGPTQQQELVTHVVAIVTLAALLPTAQPVILDIS